jgi:outer membrane protein
MLSLYCVTRRSCAALIVATTFLLSGVSFADEPKEGQLQAFTLQHAISHAKSRSPDIIAANARIQASRAFAAVPRAQWLPTFGATAQIIGSSVNNSTANILSNPRVDLPRIGATRIATEPDFTPYASTLVAAGMRQELFDFGRIAAETAALEAQVDLERYRAEGTQFDVVLYVVEAFYAVRAAKGVAKAADDAATRAAVYRDATRKAVDAGMRTPVDLARAEAEVAKFDVGKVRAKGALDAARAVFAAVVGLDQPALDADDTAIDDDVGALPSVEQLIEQARRDSLEVREAEARVTLARAETNAAGAQLRPNLFLTASLSGRAGGAPAQNGVITPGYGLVPLVPNWSVGVVLSVPLYEPTLMAHRDALKEVESARAAEREVARLAQVAAVRRAYVNVVAERQALVALERAEVAAQANHAQAEARFKAGLGTILDLVDAESLRVETEVQRAVGAFQVARARAVLERVIAGARR